MRESPPVHRPDWVNDAVFYQIFPDRYARSASATTDVAAWDSAPTRENFLGGDLRGIVERLDHLVDLGITAVYLTPIFAAGTNHRYDTIDYTRIDPRLGDDSDFDLLLNNAHRRGIRVVLDAVMHHCGDGHWAFQDVELNGRNSPYADWFFVDSFPIRTSPEPNYRTCSGCWYLPKLNVDNPALRDHLLAAVRSWTERGIDGWRLDVPYMMENSGFWRDFRRTVREVNADAYIVAEVWDEPGEWTTGETSDAAMNYQLRDALLDFFVDRRTGSAALAERCTTLSADVGDAAGHMLNLLASHDTARLRTSCGGEPALTSLATGVLLALRGAPMIYYGDEVGLAGFNDPECRGSMPWNAGDWDCDMLTRIRTFIQLRRDNIALRRGEQVLQAPHDEVLRIVRTHPEQTVVVLANRAGFPVTVPVHRAGRDLITGSRIAAGVAEIPPRRIIVMEQDHLK